jgi:amidase
VVPGAAGAAPLPDATPDAHLAHRLRTLRLTCIAGLAGAPVVVAPLVEVDGLPLGIGFLGACGSDRALLALVHDLVDDSA